MSKIDINNLLIPKHEDHNTDGIFLVIESKRIGSNIVPNECIVHLKNGNLHRENGPAIFGFNNGLEKYYINGKTHRNDGPAMIYHERKEYSYFIHGEKVAECKPDFDKHLLKVKVSNI